MHSAVCSCQVFESRLVRCSVGGFRLKDIQGLLFIIGIEYEFMVLALRKAERQKTRDDLHIYIWKVQVVKKVFFLFCSPINPQFGLDVGLPFSFFPEMTVSS